MGGKFKDIGSYVLGCSLHEGSGFLVLSSDELNARNIQNSIFLFFEQGVLKPVGPKRIHTKFLGVDQNHGSAIAVGEYGKCCLMNSTGFLSEEVLSVSGSDPAKRGPIRGGMILNRAVYAVGMHRQVYCRTPDGNWTTLENGLPAVPVGQVCGYEAVAGFSEDEIYAAGWDGEIVAFDGTSWRIIESPTNNIIVALCAGGDGLIYGCGRNGLVIRGRSDTWEVVAHGGVVDDLWSVAWCDGAVYFSSMSRVYGLTEAGLVVKDLGGLSASTFYSLASRGDVMLSVGPKNVIEFNGVGWSVID